MTAPEAQTVHPGHGIPDEGQRQLICSWLRANGIDPDCVVVNRPIYVLAVSNGCYQGGLPLLIDVIVFHQFFQNTDGVRERNFIDCDAVMFQRTVPLRVPFPVDSTEEGESA